ncbi:WD40 repeat-like protein [Hysterangium stoloniferum]|nr:WD40 repeat-like protein [Hysterangium stoloniferum]
MSRPSIYLAPSVNTTVVTTTTTTTTTYAPIPLPPLPPPSSPKDPKQYPLLNAHLPRSLRKFSLEFPGGARATFEDGSQGELEMAEEDEVVAGRGWRMLKRGEEVRREQPVGLVEAIERYGRKRSHSIGSEMEGVEALSPTLVNNTNGSPPPRKKARATGLDLRGSSMNTTNAAAPPSPLPSPNGSPPATNIWPSAPSSTASSPQPSASNAPFQPDISLSTLMTLPNILSHFNNLPQPLQSHLLLTLMRHSPLSVLRTLHSVLTPTLARDFLTLLPPELTSIILSYLPYSTLARASRVSKSWRAIIDSDPILWQELLKTTRIWFGGETERAFSDAVNARRLRLGAPGPNALPLPHPFKILFKSRHLTRTRWMNNNNPRRLTFTAHGAAVVTCLLFSHNRIISASDDHSIHVYCPLTGTQLRSLEGHEGGVWALAATKNTLVSGSTDRTVRVWNLANGRCTHVFGGHTSTVRCLAIVKPEWLEVEIEGGGVRREKWPKRSLIVTGSRDHSLRVWTLPRPGEAEYMCYGANDSDGDPAEEDNNDNPYHLRLLTGHEQAVRALAARGRTLVSGSYDCTVRVWDIIDGVCTWTLTGHTQKVYSVVLDPVRNQCCSGSMDGTVRIWNLKTGQAVHVLQGHTSLVGLLGLSPSHLVSAAADSTLRIWDPTTGQMQHTLAAHTGAITCFQHDEFKVLSGSDGTLKMWDVRDGSVVRDLLTNITGVWQVVFDGRWCVAASNRLDQTHLDVWDFGGDDDDQDWVGESNNLSDEDEDDDDVDQADDFDQGAHGDGVSDMDIVEEALDEDDPATGPAWNSAGSSAGPSSGQDRVLTDGNLLDGRITRSSAPIQMPPFNDDDSTPTRPRKSVSNRGR